MLKFPTTTRWLVAVIVGYAAFTVYDVPAALSAMDEYREITETWLGASVVTWFIAGACATRLIAMVYRRYSPIVNLKREFPKNVSNAEVAPTDRERRRNAQNKEAAGQGDGKVLTFPATIKRPRKRGASSTGQILAFPRKQRLFPQLIDAGELAAGMTALLRRALGDAIALTVTGDDGLWPCEVDPNLLESAILDLAINARDAMPDGGRFRLVSKNVTLDGGNPATPAGMESSDYVLVAVSDTGTRLPHEVVHRFFEPVLTTKEDGEGAGPGLSMVYGFVKQSGGHVTVHGDEGEGTTIRLYLPCARQGVKGSRSGRWGGRSPSPRRDHTGDR